MLIKYGTKVIGELEDGIFKKKVKASRHLMKIYDAWGIDLNAFEEHLLPINAQIKILDEESNIIYSTTAKVYQSNGIKKDFGDGRQIFLSRKHFDKESKHQQKLI